MISNPNLIFYACIAKGNTILAELSSQEPGISETLAQQCIELTPQNHSIFSHTVSNKSYTFLIDDPFTYFAIVDEKLQKSDTLWFLDRLQSTFEEKMEIGLIPDVHSLSSYCFQAQFDAVFSETISLDLEFLNSSRSGSNVSRNLSGSKGSRNLSLDVSKGTTTTPPLLAPPLLDSPSTHHPPPILDSPTGLKKKKRCSGSSEREALNGDSKHVVMENKVDVCDDVSMQKNGFYLVDHHRQKAKQIWKKHVWIVLVLDLFICAVLFGIWLWVCRGFQCMH